MINPDATPMPLVLLSPTRKEITFLIEGQKALAEPLVDVTADMSKMANILSVMAIKGPGQYDGTAAIAADTEVSKGSIGQFVRNSGDLIPDDLFKEIGKVKGRPVYEVGSFAVATALPAEGDKAFAKSNQGKHITPYALERKLVAEKEARDYQIYKELILAEDDKKVDLGIYDHLELSTSVGKYQLPLIGTEDKVAVRMISQINQLSKNGDKFKLDDVLSVVWESMPIKERSHFGDPFDSSKARGKFSYTVMKPILNALLKSEILASHIQQDKEFKYKMSDDLNAYLRLRINEPTETMDEIAVPRIQTISTVNKSLAAEISEDALEPLILPDATIAMVKSIIKPTTARLSQTDAIELLDAVMNPRYSASLEESIGSGETLSKAELKALKERIHSAVRFVLGSQSYGIAVDNRTIGKHSWHNRNSAKGARQTGGALNRGTTLKNVGEEQAQ